MTPEERSLLERTYKLAEENNEYLRSMRRLARISTFGRIVYWIVILVVGFGAYYFIQPYVESVFSLYSQIQTGTTSTPNATDLLFDLLK